MALIIEDGTGKADADVYVSVKDFDAYATKRNLLDLIDLEPEVKTAALIAATEYADSYKRYKGRRASAGQALEFPRIELQDWSSYDVEGIPKRLKDAVLFLATTVAGGTPLYETLDGQAIISEAVGPISTTYAAPEGVESRHKVFTTADKLLAPYVRNVDDLRPVPGFTAPSPNSFYTTRQDFPGSAPGQDAYEIEH